MDHIEKMAKQREFVETKLANYNPHQKQEIISQLPYMRLDDKELSEYVGAKQLEFDKQATNEEMDKVMKNLRI